MKRPRAPSMKLIKQWHQDYLDSGAQYYMSFLNYKRKQLRIWRKSYKVAK